MIKRIHLIGPMSGLPDYNRPAFLEVALNLRAGGFTVYNPGELDEKIIIPFTWENCMKTTLTAMFYCDLVVRLAGWVQSRGALLEDYVAMHLSIMRIDWYLLEEHLRLGTNAICASPISKQLTIYEETTNSNHNLSQ